MKAILRYSMPLAGVLAIATLLAERERRRIRRDYQRAVAARSASTSGHPELARDPFALDVLTDLSSAPPDYEPHDGGVVLGPPPGRWRPWSREADAVGADPYDLGGPLPPGWHWIDSEGPPR